MDRDPFAFASVNARTIAAAKLTREKFAARLGLGSDETALLKGSPAWSALLTFCIESPLNISWYDDKIAAWRRRRLTFLVGCVLVLAIVLVAIARGGFAESRIAQVSAAIAVLAACLRILSGAADVRTQLGGFWKARADLKEAFLTFEQSWTGKVLAAGQVADTFETALWQEITNARHVVRGERDTYFSTFAATGDLLSLASDGIGELMARRREVLTSQRAPIVSQMEAVAEVRRKLDEARADEVAQAHLLSLLAVRPAAMSEETWVRARDEAEHAKIAAATEVARNAELLKSVAKSSTLNPI